ncbi:transmembrane and immunoglobulin domain-containing 2-like [Solea senegalensis]|uniref:uncharacterized protein LOC122765931 n=1 Tax=Solea senegalensis TaxID=28829 RepID=UPI001C4132F9|nr:uncharacterized protein LOC122765931 [Solea senegalensis]KAG7496485.1 transmembrane and immunoglobulin domain-containing 2-like [Solea senegalensis]
MSGGSSVVKRCEKMKLLLSSVLLASLCDISSWSVLMADASAVTQTSDVSVTEGETVNITCCYTQKDSEQIRFFWLKNQTEMENNTSVVLSQYPFCASLTLSNITREDSATYICKVSLEIPYYETLYGNGTAITVKSTGSSGGHAKNSAGHSTHIMMITAAAVGFLLLLLIALCCFCFLRLGKAQAARVIYEVPHFDSEEAEMDKHNTGSSKESTQWCEVPVYESFDYFEHTQNKDSG